MEVDLGYYLGMKLVRDRVKRTITISQLGYLEDLRGKCDITCKKGSLTPMIDEPWEPEPETSPFLDAAGMKLSQRKVGSELRLEIELRPEAQFAVKIHFWFTKSTLRI